MPALPTLIPMGLLSPPAQVIFPRPLETEALQLQVLQRPQRLLRTHPSPFRQLVQVQRPPLQEAQEPLSGVVQTRRPWMPGPFGAVRPPQGRLPAERPQDVGSRPGRAGGSLGEQPVGPCAERLSGR